MKYTIICLISLLSGFHPIYGQAKFITEGKIEFERRINMQRQTDESREFIQDALSKLGNFHSSSFSLAFDSTKTVYQLSGQMPSMPFGWLIGPAKENVVYTDVSTGQKQSAKQVFEESYLVADSITNQWKITDEKRTIAGFECRKAVTRICDSVYVVAFYTDEIPVSSGPESFGGLPGMILGLVVPRLYTTWFATNLTLASPTSQDLKTPGKGKKINKAQLETTLKSSLSDWGQMGEKNIWWTML